MQENGDVAHLAAVEAGARRHQQVFAHGQALEDAAALGHVGDAQVGALKRLSLSIHRGEFAAIIGHSGSGKSTLMNMIGCLDTPTSGTYFLNGQDVSALSDNALSAIRNEPIGFIFQSFNLIKNLHALENVALWHERDISHSSVERAIGPDTTITLDFALHRLAGVVEKLVIYPDTRLANMKKFRVLVMSQGVLMALTQAGVSSEDSYRLVQRNAMKVWEKGADFLEELLGDEEVRAALSEEDIREKFDLGYHTKHVDTIFARVFQPTVAK